MTTIETVPLDNPTEYNYYKEWYQRNLVSNRAKRNDRNKRFRQEDREKANQIQKDWAKANPESRKATYRKHDLKRKYGITPEEFNAILAQQNGACAICKNTVTNGKNWHVDHNHKTKKVRGILCNNCNLLLGHAKDNKQTLVAAMEYLECN